MKAGKIIKCTAKILAWCLGSIVALLFAALFALQTPFVKRKIADVAERQVNGLLNAELSVGRLRGNLFTHIGLDDLLLLSPARDTIASVSRLELSYSLFPLLDGVIWVDDITLDRPYVHLQQYPDSSWNVATILKPTDNDADTTASTPFGMTVRLNRFLLNNGAVRADVLSDAIPDRIDSLCMDLSGSYSRQKQELKLNTLRLNTSRPDLHVKDFSIFAEADTSRVKLDSLTLKTGLNGIRAWGEYHFSTQTGSCITLKTGPVHFEEFRAWLPDGFPFQAEPDVQIEGCVKGDSLNLYVAVDDRQQQATLQASTYNVLAWLADSAFVPAYDLWLQLGNVDLRRYVDNPALDYRIQRATCRVEGNGADPKTLHASLQLHAGDMVAQGYSADTLALSLDYAAGDVKGHVSGQGDFGSFYLTPRLWNMWGMRPYYQLGLHTRHLDVSALLRDKAYPTDVNLRASVKGNGRDLKTLMAQGRLTLRPSDVMGVRIDTLDTEMNYADNDLQVDRLLLGALSATVRAKGHYRFQGISEFWLEAQADSMQAINELAGLDGLDTRIRLDAYAQGTPDSLRAELRALALGTRFNGLSADTLQLMANGSLEKKSLSASALLRIDSARMNEFRLDRTDLQLETDTRNYRVAFNTEGKDVHARFNTQVQLADTIMATLSGLAVGYRGYDWQQATDTAFVTLQPDRYKVSGFRLTTDSSSRSSSIDINGWVSRTDSQQLQVLVDRVDIGRVFKTLDVDLPLTGLAGLNVHVSGPASSPGFTAVLDVDSVQLERLRFDTVQSRIRLVGKNLFADFRIVPDNLGRIYGDGQLPADIRLDSMIFQLPPAGNDSVRANLLVEQIPLSVLNLFVDADEVTGTLNSRVAVDGSLSRPQLSGALRLDSGLVKIDRYGIDYRNIQAGLQFGTDSVRIDTFLIQSTDGSMTAHGGIQFQSELYKADLSSSLLSVDFNRFNPFNHKQFKMEMSGGVQFTANADSTTFAGDISIPEANIYLPAVMALMGKSSAPDINRPLLLAELEKTLQPGDSIVYSYRPDAAQTDTAGNTFEFLKNLQGEVKVSIPRNTWIRNQDMRIELSGDVRLMKHRDFFEIFGSIDVVRGQYNLLGKVFVIQSGTVSFQGGEKIDPILNIDAVYSFRDPYRNKRDLGITVNGGLDDLTITFKLEGEKIGEGDALSYIIFGRALSELSTAESSGIDPGKLAGMAAASLISSQLTKLGNKFNVDYIEVDVGDSFDNASLTVGKYITNKLFISYEQRIGTLEDKDTARYEMTLEYELFKFLFLQLTSSPITNGFDLIFKMDSK